MAKRRPFFSIVIPCYNDGRYEKDSYLDRVLFSLCNQGLKKADSEVIIVDDHSPVPYDDVIDTYRKKLNIKVTQTDYNFGPGNTRQKGAEEAAGQWLCFIDHDDTFVDLALSKVKSCIENNNILHVLYTDFNKISVDEDAMMEVTEEFRGNQLKSWVHGKFYNIDNFWKPFKLHFIKDLKTHEDLALGRLVECALLKLNESATYYPEITYLWYYNPDSISHSEYFPDGENSITDFTRSHFDNYLTSQIRTVIDAYKNEVIDKSIATSMIIPALVSAWLSLATFKADTIYHYLQINDAYCSRIWHEIKETFNADLTIIKVVINKAFSKLIEEANKVAEDNTIPVTFLDWLTELDTLDYESIIEHAQDIMNESAKVAEELNQEESSGVHRPFFSCIIPCYNDGRYGDGVYLDRLLDSLLRQGIDKDDLEVILSDDCSPVSFIDRIIDKYGDSLNIKYIKTDYNFAPGNTRAKGVTIATGRWLCFADHDDIYYDNALDQAMRSIIEKNEQHFAFGDFEGVTPEGNLVRKYECTLSWCHAKFYNKDNFWDKYGIHFIKDLKSHEDIAICTQVSCALSANVPTYTYIQKMLYAWTDNPQSVSHAKYTVGTDDGERRFLEVFYEDYLKSTGYMYLEQFDTHNIKITYAIKGALEIMCYAYFYQQSFIFDKPDNYYKENLKIAGKYIDRCKKTFNLTNDKIYDAVSANMAFMYYTILKQANIGTGRYIPQQTFRQWLDIVSPDH